MPNAQILAAPETLLSEDFTAEDMHPADVAQIIEAAFEEYQEIPAYTKLKTQYRKAYNRLVDVLSEKRGFVQYSHI